MAQHLASGLSGLGLFFFNGRNFKFRLEFQRSLIPTTKADVQCCQARAFKNHELGMKIPVLT